MFADHFSTNFIKIVKGKTEVTNEKENITKPEKNKAFENSRELYRRKSEKETLKQTSKKRFHLLVKLAITFIYMDQLGSELLRRLKVIIKSNRVHYHHCPHSILRPSFPDIQNNDLRRMTYHVRLHENSSFQGKPLFLLHIICNVTQFLLHHSNGLKIGSVVKCITSQQK